LPDEREGLSYEREKDCLMRERERLLDEREREGLPDEREGEGLPDERGRGICLRREREREGLPYVCYKAQKHLLRRPKSCDLHFIQRSISFEPSA